MQNETTTSAIAPTWLYTASFAVLAAWFASGITLVSSILGQ